MHGHSGSNTALLQRTRPPTSSRSVSLSPPAFLCSFLCMRCFGFGFTVVSFFSFFPRIVCRWLCSTNVVARCFSDNAVARPINSSGAVAGCGACAACLCCHRVTVGLDLPQPRLGKSAFFVFVFRVCVVGTVLQRQTVQNLHFLCVSACRCLRLCLRDLFYCSLLVDYVAGRLQMDDGISPAGFPLRQS